MICDSCGCFFCEQSGIQGICLACEEINKRRKEREELKRIQAVQLWANPTDRRAA